MPKTVHTSESESAIKCAPLIVPLAGGLGVAVVPGTLTPVGWASRRSGVGERLSLMMTVARFVHIDYRVGVVSWRYSRAILPMFSRNSAMASCAVSVSVSIRICSA